MLARTAGALLTALTLALLAAAPAVATFPGMNGKIVFAGCGEGTGGTSDCGLFIVNLTAAGEPR